MDQNIAKLTNSLVRNHVQTIDPVLAKMFAIKAQCEELPAGTQTLDDMVDFWFNSNSNNNNEEDFSKRKACSSGHGSSRAKKAKFDKELSPDEETRAPDEDGDVAKTGAENVKPASNSTAEDSLLPEDAVNRGSGDGAASEASAIGRSNEKEGDEPADDSGASTSAGQLTGNAPGLQRAELPAAGNVDGCHAESCKEEGNWFNLLLQTWVDPKY